MCCKHVRPLHKCDDCGLCSCVSLRLDHVMCHSLSHRHQLYQQTICHTPRLHHLPHLHRLVFCCPSSLVPLINSLPLKNPCPSCLKPSAVGACLILFKWLMLGPLTSLKHMHLPAPSIYFLCASIRSRDTLSVLSPPRNVQ